MSNEETVASLPIKEQVDLLAQALLREHMHRCNFRQTLKKFDEECPRDERTISSRALMKQLLNIPVNGRVSRLQPRKGGNGKSIAPTFMEELCSYRLTKREYAVHANKHRSNSNSNKRDTGSEEEQESNEDDANDDPSDVEIRELEERVNNRKKEIAHIEMLKERAAVLREKMLVQKKLKEEEEFHKVKEDDKWKEADRNVNEVNNTNLGNTDENEEHDQYKEKRKKEKNKKKNRNKHKKNKKHENDQNKENTLYEAADNGDENTHSKRWLVSTELGQSASYNEANQLHDNRNTFNNEGADESSDAYSDQLEQTVRLTSESAPANVVGAHWMPPSADTLAVQKIDKRNSLNNSSNTSFEFGVESLQSTPVNSNKKNNIEKNVLNVSDRSDADDLLKYDPLFAPHKSIRDLALEDSSSSSSNNSDSDDDNINSGNKNKRKNRSIASNNVANGEETDKNNDTLNGHHHHYSDDMNEFVRRQIENNKANVTHHKEHNEEDLNHVERRASGSISSGLSLSFDRPQLNKSELREVWRPSETKSSSMNNSKYLNSPFAHSKINQTKNITATNRTKVGLNAAGYSASASTPSFTTSASRLFAAEPTLSSSSTLPLPAPQTGSILVHHDHHASTTSTSNSSSTSTAKANNKFTTVSSSSSQQYEPQDYKPSNQTASFNNNNNDDSNTTSRLSHAVSERPAHFELYNESIVANTSTMPSSNTMMMMTSGSPEHSNSHSFSTSTSYSAQPVRRVGVGFNFNKTKDNKVINNMSNASPDHSTSGMSNSRKSRSVTIISE